MAQTHPRTPRFAEAITFGRTDVVRILIHAGADTGLTESSGVNLVHWATITGRAGVIPLLAKAGVPVNDSGQGGLHAADVCRHDRFWRDFNAASLARGRGRSDDEKPGRAQRPRAGPIPQKRCD